MAWKTVYIVVEADSVEEAEEKALEVFESEGGDVCDGQFELESGEEDNNKTFQIKDLLNDKSFLDRLKMQIKEYSAYLIKLSSIKILDGSHLKEIRGIYSDYHPYLSPKITHHSVLYNGITYEPVLDIYDIPNDAYLVPIMFHY